MRIEHLGYNARMNFVTRTFLKGLAAVLPIAITVYFVVWLAVGAERGMRAMIQGILPDEYDKYYVPGVGVIVGVVIIFVIGVLLNAWLTARLFEIAERILDRIPLVKSLYGSVKDLLGFFMGGDKKADSQVVMVDVGGTGQRILGLMTRTDFTDVPDGIGGNDQVAVYLPMSYQLGGFTVMVSRDAIETIDMTTEDALRFAVTAGMASSATDMKKPLAEQVDDRADDDANDTHPADG